MLPTRYFGSFSVLAIRRTTCELLCRQDVYLKGGPTPIHNCPGDWAVVCMTVLVTGLWFAGLLHGIHTHRTLTRVHIQHTQTYAHTHAVDATCAWQVCRCVPKRCCVLHTMVEPRTTSTVTLSYDAAVACSQSPGTGTLNHPRNLLSLQLPVSPVCIPDLSLCCFL